MRGNVLPIFLTVVSTIDQVHEMLRGITPMFCMWAETTFQCVLVMDGAMPFALFRDAYISSFHPKPGKHIFREEDKHYYFSAHCFQFNI